MRHASLVLRASSLLLPATMLAATACDEAEEQGPPMRTYHFITHADPENTFWDPVRSGMEAAARERNVEAFFFGAPREDISAGQQQADQVEAAIAADVDGIAITLSDPAVLAGPLQDAVAAGIPVIGINVSLTPEDQERYDIPISTYVGQIETTVGERSALHARDLLAEGGRELDVAMCLKGMREAAWAVQRCQGMEEALAPLGIEVTTLGANFYSTPPEIPEAEIRQWFVDHPEVDFVFATTTAPLGLLLSMRRDGVIAEDVMIGTVDLDEATLEAVRDGSVAFAVDQQPYLQGYLPVMLFELENEYLLQLGAYAQTGPFYVDASNVDRITELVRQEVR